MALPKAVQAQEDAANNMFDGEGNDQTPNGNTAQPAPAQQPQATSEPAQQQHVAQPQQNAQPVASVIDIPGQQQAAAPEGNTDLQARFDALEQQFRVIKGKYDHELPRYAEQVRDLREENEKLKKQVEESTAGNDVNQAVETLAEVLDEESVKALQSIIRGEFSKLDKRIETVTNDVQRTQQESMTNAQRNFYTNLTDWAPTWEQLNNDAGFKSFLDNTARSGMTLSQQIKNAFERLDAAGVAKIFNEYNELRQTQTSELDGQIMPGQGGGGVHIDQSQNQQISDDEYAQANKELALGRMSQDEFNKLENAYYAQNGIS